MACSVRQELGRGFACCQNFRRELHANGSDFALPGFDLFVYAVHVIVVLTTVVRYAAFADLDNAGRDLAREVPVVAREDHRALVLDERIDERINGVHVEVVTGFVEDQDVVIAEQQPREAQSCALAAGENRNRLINM